MLSSNRQSGFTLPELIAVIIISSVFAATAVAKWSGSGTNLAADAERLASDIRYIQSYSSTHDQRYRINFLSDRYGFTNLAGTTALLHPVTNGAQVMQENGVVLMFTHSYLAFDGLGVPYATATVPGTPLASTAIITLARGNESRTVRISHETGRVVVQ
jgi:prepilin-type N-terminal cleavage/methylation domain-containing protein